MKEEKKHLSLFLIINVIYQVIKVELLKYTIRVNNYHFLEFYFKVLKYFKYTFNLEFYKIKK